MTEATDIFLENLTSVTARGFNYEPGYASHGIEIWGDAFNLAQIDCELAVGSLKKMFKTGSFIM